MEYASIFWKDGESVMMVLFASAVSHFTDLSVAPLVLNVNNAFSIFENFPERSSAFNDFPDHNNHRNEVPLREKITVQKSKFCNVCASYVYTMFKLKSDKVGEYKTWPPQKLRGTQEEEEEEETNGK